MLRIKRHNTQSIVSFREKENFLSLALLGGAGWALFFHILFFLLFKIVLPQAPEIQDPLPPICVEIECRTLPREMRKKTTFLEHSLAPELVTPLVLPPLNPCYETWHYSIPDLAVTDTMEYESLNIDFTNDRD